MPENDVLPDVRATAVVDLLGMLAFAELLAFDRMAADARLAPDIRRRAALSEMAAAEIANYGRLVGRLTALGADPDVAMKPFTDPLRAYHDQTRPADWHEGLTKAYVGDSVADDFAREVAQLLDAEDRELILDVLHESEHAQFAAAELRLAIEADPKLANRLSIWARRLVGEGLSQAMRVAVDRPAMAAMVAAGACAAAAGKAVDGGIPSMLRRLTAAHTARMTAVGLNN